MVKVEIFSIAKISLDNSNLIRYRITNFYKENIYVVADNWFTFKYNDTLIEISFARTEVIEGAQVFGYFLPVLQIIKPEESIEKELRLSWPLRLNTIWNKQAYAHPAKGLNKLKMKIGYGFSENIEEHQEFSIEENIQNWQKMAESKVCDIII